MVGSTDHSPFPMARKTPWSSRLRMKRITQAELAKRPDPFFLPNLLDGFEDTKYGWLADDIKRLCELKRNISVEDDNKSRQHKKPLNSAPILLTDSDDDLSQESVTPLDFASNRDSERIEEAGDKRVKKLKPTEKVVIEDDYDDEHWSPARDEFTDGSADNDVKIGSCSGSETSSQNFDEEDSSRISTDSNNGTPLYGDGEEEEELWRQLAFAQESSKISLGASLYIHPKLKSFLEENPSNGEKGFAENNTWKLDELLKEINVREGVKMKFFLNLVALCESTGEKLLVFSQYIFPLKTLERLMSSRKGWRLGKEMFTITGDLSNEQREFSTERFNNSPDAKVFFGSIKACGEGISLVGASRVLILDVHLNPSVTQQAVARAYRPGQKKKVYSYRLVAADSLEEENYETCLRKEMISKMWFEWNVGSRRGDFGFRAIDVDDSGDDFLETTKMREDIKTLYTR